MTATDNLNENSKTRDRERKRADDSTTHQVATNGAPTKYIKN